MSDNKTVKVICESCYEQLVMDVLWLNKTIPCPKCNTPILVEDMAGPASAPPPPPPSAPGRQGDRAAAARPSSAVSPAAPPAVAPMLMAAPPAVAVAIPIPAAAPVEPVRRVQSDVRSAVPVQAERPGGITGERRKTINEPRPISSVNAPVPASLSDRQTGTRKISERRDSPRDSGRRDGPRESDRNRTTRSSGRNETVSGRTQSLRKQKQDQQKKLVIGLGIGGGVLALLVAVGVAMSSKPNDDDGGRTAKSNSHSNGNAAKPKSEADELALMQEQLAQRMKACGNVGEKLRALEEWSATVNNTPSLKGQFCTLARTALYDAREEVKKVAQDSTDHAARLAGLGAWAKRCFLEDEAKDLFQQALKQNENNEKARTALGFVKYELPKVDDIQAMYVDNLLNDMEPYMGKWLSPDEYAKVKRIEDEAVRKGREIRAEWKADPFLQGAHQAERNLKANTFFKNYQFDVFVSRPFVVLMTKEGTGRQRWNERKTERSATLSSVWREWRNNVVAWNLKSNKPGDTVESPQPFVWVSFETETAYQQYLAETGVELPPTARAFYDRNTQMVMFYENEGDIENDTIIHETVHQLMDRYSVGGNGSYKNHCVAEGYPEYFSGFTGKGADMKFFQSTQNRGTDISYMRAIFNEKIKGYPGQMTDDDWIFFDAPMLLTLRDRAWVLIVSENVMYETLVNNTKYRNKRNSRALLARASSLFSPMFYAYAWSFQYWLHKNYPEQMLRFERAYMAGQSAEAEVFLRAFNIRPSQPLPDLGSICGESNARLQDERNYARAFAVWQQRDRILRETPEIKKMNLDYIQYLRDTFPPDKDVQDEPSATPGSSDDPEASEAKTLIQTLAKQASEGNVRAMMMFGFIINRLVEEGMTQSDLDKILGEVGLKYDIEGGTLTKTGK